MALEITGDPLSKFHALIKQLDDESYVWMTDLFLMNPLQKEDDKILKCLIEQANLKNLKSYLDNKLRQLDKEDLEQWEDRFKRNKAKLLPSEHLQTFRQDRRLSWFAIHSLIRQNRDISISKLNFSDPYLYLLYLIYIKITPFKLDEQIDELVKIRKNFNKILEEKNNLNKYIDDPDFTQWAYSYIQDHRDIRRSHPDIMGFPIDSLQNKKDYILSLFDYKFYIDDHEKSQYLIAINRLKKAWQQKMFRDKGSVKQPYHIPLTKTAKNELKKLAEFKNKTEGVLLSELIHKAYVKEMCDENGKALY